MAMVDVDNSSLQVDSQHKSVGLLDSRMALFYFYQMNQMNSCNDYCHNDSAIDIVKSSLLLLLLLLLLL